MIYVPGTLVPAYFVDCGGVNDDSNCVEEITITDAATRILASQKLKERYKWALDKERGWVCPKCAAKLKAARTRAATKAAKVKHAGTR